MATLIISNTSGTSYAPAPEGTHVARCIGLIDLGTHETTGKFGTKHEHKIRVSFELPEELDVFSEEKGEEPYVVSQDFTASLHEKAKLRAFLEAWRGKKFTEDEAKGFDIAKLIGVPAMLNVIHAERNGKTYANIASASRLPKNTDCPPQIIPSTVFSLSAFDEEVFDSLPEWMRKKIADSPEYRALSKSGNAGADAEGEDDGIPF